MEEKGDTKAPISEKGRGIWEPSNSTYGIRMARNKDQNMSAMQKSLIFLFQKM